ncbi:MAG TPA: DNA polymerase/3'-5' exonuclease PolX [Candidatus Limnocylindrales bacterium]|nr:DNA polymerase/3'-5' exonuclease PolX [Candidatus Limnocylindrales bacterium]
MKNAEVAAMLNRIADLLEIRGENFFKIRAYREAVRQLDNLTTEVEDMIQGGRLRQVPGIGEAIEKKIVEYVTTGTLPFLEKLEVEVPPALLQLTRVPGLGPRTAKDIYDTLGIVSLDALEEAASAHRLQAVPGIKARTEENILKGLAMLKRTEGRLYFPEASLLADSLLATLRELRQVVRAEVAGSLRRARETVGDIDLLVACPDPAALCGQFARLPQVAEVIAQGDTKASVRVRSGMQVDLRAVTPDQFGAAWQYFTGSQAHNVQLRGRAERLGRLKINEYGVFREDGTRIAGETEEDVYAAVGCAWIPPELREGMGEIEAAASRTLPTLIEATDLRGELHAHSTWSDGRSDIATMARAAQARGYHYMALTDHTQSLAIANGLTPERFTQRAAEIAAVNASMPDFRVLSGAEVDILPDGSLDLPDEVLASLDVVVASVHTALDQSREAMTERVLTALRSPHVDVLGHPTCRRLDRRGETSVDLETVIAEAARTGTALEINSSPMRLDLNDAWARRAREAGVLLAIDCDAHYPAEFDYPRWGSAIARRAGLQAQDVLNTREVEGVLAHARAKAARVAEISR